LKIYKDRGLHYKTGNVRVKVTLRRVRATIVAVKKQRVLHNSQFMFVALVIKRAMRMRRIDIYMSKGYFIIV
jgi:hypothetical protein